ncbi:hypothetical protein Tco_1474079 [Tanacetum coccineum]
MLPVAYQVSGPAGPTCYTPPGPTYFPYMSAQVYASPSVPPGQYYPPAHPVFAAQQVPQLLQAQSQVQPTGLLLPVQPAPSAQQVNLTQSTVPSGQATILPHAFTVGTLHDLATGT